MPTTVLVQKDIATTLGIAKPRCGYVKMDHHEIRSENIKWTHLVRDWV